MRPLLALILLCAPGPAAAQDARCAVEDPGIDLREVVVRVPGEAPLTLTVRGARVTAHPRGTAHPVTVQAGLAFSGTSDSPVFSLSRPLSTAAGIVRLSTAVKLARVHAVGADVSATVELNPFVHVVGLRIPCDALTLGFPPDAPVDPQQPEGDGTVWAPRSALLEVRLRPGEGPGVRVRAGAPGILQLVRTERRGDYFRITWRQYDGSGFSGWVAATAVRPWTPAGWGGPSGFGEPGCMRSGQRGGTGLYGGPATVRQGAEVHTRPDGPAWATFESTEPALIYHVRGEDWVQLRAAPGVSDQGYCDQLSRAFVRLADVTLPPDADAQRGQ